MKKLFAALSLVLLLHLLPTRLLLLAANTLVVSPGWQRLTDDQSKYWEAQTLQMQLETLGYSVEYVELKGAYGLTRYDSHSIYIEKSMHWTDRYRTLLHEAAHALRPQYMSGANGEMFAEGVSFLVCRCGYREPARYLASNRPALLALVAYQGDIYRVAGFLR